MSCQDPESDPDFYCFAFPERYGCWLLTRWRPVIFMPAFRPRTVPWPGGIVPYEFTNSLTSAETNTYLDGLREWELAANVKFVPHTNQANWILFSYNTNFIDYVSGGGYSPQIVTVSSLSRAQVCHEMGHSFGFNHENIRPDATNYIAVLTNNITDEPANIHWFTPDPTTVTNGNYDYESVMHLGWDFDSTNPGVLATQQPLPPNFPRYQFRMGNYCLSPGDRAALAYLYPPAVTLTNIVTTTADFGTNSLRAAMYYATDHPGTTVKFNIPVSDPGYSNGVFNIHLTGHLPPLVANGMVIDGSTQPGFTSKPLIVVDASQIIPETFTSDTVLIYSSSNQLKNIAFTGFDWNGLTLLYAGRDEQHHFRLLAWPRFQRHQRRAQRVSGNSHRRWRGREHHRRHQRARECPFRQFAIRHFHHRHEHGRQRRSRKLYWHRCQRQQRACQRVERRFHRQRCERKYHWRHQRAWSQCPFRQFAIRRYHRLEHDRQCRSWQLHRCERRRESHGFQHLWAACFWRPTPAKTSSAARTPARAMSFPEIWEMASCMRGSSVVNNAVQGNFIGTDATGTNALPNTVAGVTIDTGSSSNLIGGTRGRRAQCYFRKQSRLRLRSVRHWRRHERQCGRGKLRRPRRRTE